MSSDLVDGIHIQGALLRTPSGEITSLPNWQASFFWCNLVQLFHNDLDSYGQPSAFSYPE
jgi:hypothetical protein